MIATINYPKESKAKSLGRNGLMKTTGLSILAHNNSLNISPITSKGLLGRCIIEVPKETIPELIRELRSLHQSLGDS